MDDFSEIADPPKPAVLPNAAQLQSGPFLPPMSRILLYSPDEWEAFINEWASACLKSKYSKVVRFSGANDRGIDVAGFVDANLLNGVWDNYQCKHYGAGITPGTAWPEIGKILWHSFNGHYKPPRAYYFVAPRSVGTSLAQLLSNSPKLKADLKTAWAKSVADNITSKETIALTGAFASYVDAFDFTIFKWLTPSEIVEQHRKSPYFIARFGGGLPFRPKADSPPDEIQPHEQRYVASLLAAYSDHQREAVADVAALKQWKPLKDHFLRQRESFYHAESFRVFVREKVEPGTYESLQDEVFNGVVDTAEATHADGFECVKAVAQAAQNMSLDAHPLGPSAYTKDRHGICHQLANEDRLKWTK